MSLTPAKFSQRYFWQIAPRDFLRETGTHPPTHHRETRANLLAVYCMTNTMHGLPFSAPGSSGIHSPHG